MSFVITIVEKRTVKKAGGMEWVKIGEEPTSKEDQMKAFAPDKLPPMKEMFGYNPEIQVEKTEEVEILKQEVRELPLMAVIKAINGIP